jgi:hypothetical protein
VILKFFKEAMSKKVFIIGNSKEGPGHLKSIKITEDDYVIRFNKAHLHTSDFNCLICNNVIFKKYILNNKNRNWDSFSIERISCYLTAELALASSQGLLFTTGLLFVSWLIKFSPFFKSISLLGFNMVEPGERAHFFDLGTPATKSERFAGHNANFERNYMKGLSEQKIINLVI